MKRATIAIPEDLDEVLTAFGRGRGIGSDPDAVVEVAPRGAGGRMALAQRRGVRRS